MNIILAVDCKAVKTHEFTFDCRHGDVLKLLLDELGREVPWSASCCGLDDIIVACCGCKAEDEARA